MSNDSARRSAFRAFLSHRYEAVKINLYLTSLFWQVARDYTLPEPLFDVDISSGSTNVTRLERMMQRTNAFVGIFPLRKDDPYSPNLEQGQQSAKYFLLELDIAIRSGKFGLIFYDRRYPDIFKVSPLVTAYAFDHLELESNGPKASEGEIIRLIRSFLQKVDALKHVRESLPGRPGRGRRVVLALPENKGKRAAYPRKHRDAILDILKTDGWSIKAEISDATLSLSTISALESVDMVVTDIGPREGTGALAAYLHGRMMPILRLQREPLEDRLEEHSVAQVLYGEMKVGYPKDIVRWNDLRVLRRELKARLERIKEDSKLLEDEEIAREHFKSAARRNERVFLSYAGADADVVKSYGDELRHTFRDVFDYRDGESVKSGKSWISEVHDNLAKSPIGVLMLSPAYVKSRYCMREAEHMVDRSIGGKMTMIPIKLAPKEPAEKLELPPFLSPINYIRASELDNDPTRVVKRLLNDLV